MWGYNIRVVIVPSFLALAFLGSLIYLHSPSDFNLWTMVSRNLDSVRYCPYDHCTRLSF